MTWEQLLDIRKENSQDKADYDREPPAACPLCGDLLEVHPGGRRNCPLGHYRWDGEPKIL